MSLLVTGSMAISAIKRAEEIRLLKAENASLRAELDAAHARGREEGYAAGFSDGQRGAYASANVVREMARALPTASGKPAPKAE